MTKIINTIQEIAYHRNGISGVGFHAVRFTSDIEGQGEEEARRWGLPVQTARRDANFLAIVHEEPGYCSVVCLDLIPTCGVKFAGGNSWRGDCYEDELRRAIREWEEERDRTIAMIGGES